MMIACGLDDLRLRSGLKIAEQALEGFSVEGRVRPLGEASEFCQELSA